jgi:hydroxymethylpyrimidine pyrophosphatase-like HAD family hydrolase
MRIMEKSLSGFEVRRGGLTSIDVTMKGIDKAYGVRQIEKILRIPIKDMIFVGDALYKGGNDAAAKKTGVQTMAVKGPADTIAIIKKILKN